MFDKPICHIKSPYLLPEITQKYLMYGKTLQEVPFTFSMKIYPKRSKKGRMVKMSCETVS